MHHGIQSTIADVSHTWVLKYILRLSHLLYLDISAILIMVIVITVFVVILVTLCHLRFWPPCCSFFLRSIVASAYLDSPVAGWSVQLGQSVMVLWPAIGGADLGSLQAGTSLPGPALSVDEGWSHSQPAEDVPEIERLCWHTNSHTKTHSALGLVLVHWYMKRSD